jgi:hypothetical protein
MIQQGIRARKLAGKKRAAIDRPEGLPAELSGVDYERQRAKLPAHGIERMDQFAAVRSSDTEVIQP